MKRILTTALMCLMAVIGINAQENVTYEAFAGTLNNGKTAVQVFLEQREDGLTAGWILYPNAKRPAHVLLVGNSGEDADIGQYLNLNEYQKDGHLSGLLFIKKADVGYAGTWSHLDTEYDLVLNEPIDYPEELKNQLAPATKAQMGKKYAFEYDHITGDMRGGTALFTPRNNGKLAYDISVYAPNLADGKGVGVLYDNVMTGVEEDANYEFHVEFFPKFCVITNIVGPDEAYYGAWTTFAHVYIKVK